MSTRIVLPLSKVSKIVTELVIVAIILLLHKNIIKLFTFSLYSLQCRFYRLYPFNSNILFKIAFDIYYFCCRVNIFYLFKSISYRDYILRVFLRQVWELRCILVELINKFIKAFLHGDVLRFYELISFFLSFWEYFQWGKGFFKTFNLRLSSFHVATLFTWSLISELLQNLFNFVDTKLNFVL